MRSATMSAVAVLLLLPLMGRCAAPPAKEPAWLRQAEKAGLGADDVERLYRNKILVGRTSAKQVFSFYLGGDLPHFITTDSLLNAYHVLYEESILRLESAQARRLPKLLRELWDALKEDGLRLEGDDDLAAAARKRARLIVGVALDLVGDKAARDDRTLGATVKEQAEHVVAAKGAGKPKWLGPADKGFVALDYTRYAPRGFYVRNERLQRHFRAVSWLQSIPFRIDRDEELLSALVLGSCLRSAGKLSERWRPACRGYQDFIGGGDDWDLLTMEQVAEGIGEKGWLDGWPERTADTKPRLDLGGKDLGKVRSALKKHAKGKGGSALINDQLAYVPQVGFRVLSASRLPDAVLFARTTDRKQFSREFPEGLEVCALLGSSFAAERLGGKDAGAVRKVIGDSKDLLSGRSLYHDYLRCLEPLLGPAEKDAPALFRSQAWQAKSCQTALGGWAQMRHTWVLQAKLNVTYLSSFVGPAGTVEPNPEFYVRLGELARRTADLLEEQEAMGPDLLDLADKLRLVVASSDKKYSERTPKEISALYSLMGLELKGVDLKKLADQLERGEMPADEKLRECLRYAGTNLEYLWKRLAQLCDRLETLAHKQLRGAAFNKRDEAFVRGYGKDLAAIMLYQGNSYVRPEDDAPRIVDVFTNPTTRKAPYLEVGIGRPRELYVVYPYRGKEILCRGAVLPYHEFAYAERLDDAGWKKLLDSREAPQPPAWVRPILSPKPAAAPRKD
jgi:hypothetical protein